jgi:tRNA pseudouridine55 synthase
MTETTEQTSTIKQFPEFNFAEGELLLINKPYKWTSFDVVGKIRNSLKPQKLKVGHAGTLDPLATGLLIICTGKLTKQIDQEFPIDHLTDEQIHAATAAFTGDIQQYPPAHSAVKVNGERLYVKARRGEETELRLRFVTVSAFEITRIALPEVEFRIVCSKGTYIRSLISDFGTALNSGAYLSKLTRTRSGDFLLENAFEVNELVNYIRNNKQI